MVTTRSEFLVVEALVRAGLEQASTGSESCGDPPCPGRTIQQVLRFLMAPAATSPWQPTDQAASGRSMRATRTIRTHELVFPCEAAFAYVKPSARKRVCQSCHGVAARRLERVCRGCHLAHYCSAGCEARDRALHSRVCSASLTASKFKLRKSGGTSSKGMMAAEHELFQAVVLFILETHSQDLPLDRLQELQWEGTTWTETEAVIYGHVADFAVAFLRERFQDDSALYAVTAAVALGLIARFQLNGFDLCTRGGGGQGLGLLVFKEMSMFNHSCRPNVEMEVIDCCQFLFALRPIADGEEVCFNYVPLDQPVVVRRKLLEDTYGFICQCPRCMEEELAATSKRKGKKHGKR